MIAEAVRIVDETSFTWFGSPSRALPEVVRDRISPADRRAYLLASLRDRIYRDAYCAGSPRAATNTGGIELTLGGRDTTLASQLAAANTGQGAWEPGWTVTSVEDVAAPSQPQSFAATPAIPRSLGVEARGLRIWLRDGEYRHAGGVKPKSGDPVDIRLPRGSFDISPGYYSALSDTPMPDTTLKAVIRLYLAVRPEFAPMAMAEITGSLNQCCIPFRFKMLSDPGSYDRCDTAVLYLSKDNAGAAAQPVADAISRLRPFLKDAVPAFTLRAIAGIGLAEEPETKESFGEHRSGLTAEGIIRMADVTGRGGELTLAPLLETWAEASIDLAAPHLNPSSSGEAIEVIADAIRRTTSKIHASSSKELPGHDIPMNARVKAQSTYLEVASGIASQLVKEAIWYEDRCTWLGSVPASDERGKPSLSHGSIGSSLYDGGAGVALFLALMGALSSIPDAAETAGAAARQALRALVNEPDNGLFTGRAGTILCAVAIGVLNQDNEMLEAAEAALQHLRSRSGSGTDLLSGRSGTIIAFLCLAPMLNDDSLLRDAERLGMELLQQANISSYGYSWTNEAAEHSPDLTGLSHGAAGIAAALVELSRATGIETFSCGAREAFRYERSWFSSKHENWPDLREADERTARTTPQSFLGQWCHGAPGIAMSRIRAAEFLDDAVLRSEAAIAIRTTAKETVAAMSNMNFSFSLCHGLAGNADILLESLSSPNAGRHTVVDPNSRSGTVDLLSRIAAQGYRRHHLGDSPWPCGVPVPGVTVPGLMLGTAGIGYHYLRLAFPRSVPSILLPQPEGFGRRLREVADSGREIPASLS
ncbi:T3SS effector HopA1 family protein [Pseudarthrobacter sp. H3Y2-7]|uniref:lanthionine synthetase LanC family protein n=1 Tax=Pseudarthrobacter naphthalenicus TaxID=3031328 RepID=UPI0023B1E4A2|nr:lanthionine synthetase LanC family protein [Pseudarthrobacter sp. H3Y2-7]MDE8668423.1 T3SS effector HopA1 family protein [Pseudarthrobacter sp. H3Y2-7]